MKVGRMAALTVALVLSFVLPGVPGVARADSSPWSAAASMPTARMGLASVSLGSYVYAIGGNNGSSSLSTVEAYYPPGNTWIARAPLLTPRSGLAAAVLNGRIYVFGGSNSMGQLASVESYSLTTNSWTSLAPMPTARTGAAAVAGLDGRIYVIGGYSGSKGYLNTVEIYSPTANTWATGPAMPTSRAWLAAALAPDGRIVAIGGTSGAGPLSTVQAYAVGTGIWTALQPMPTARYGAAAVVGSDGRIYVIGGTSSTALPTVEGYTPSTNTWLSAYPLQVARTSAGATTWQDGRILVMGGRTSAGVIVGTVEVCSLPGPVVPTPPAPVGVVATPGNGQITLTWTAPPVAPGNPAIDHYTVDVYSGATHVAFYDHVAHSPFVVTGLTNGVAYQFLVTSVDVQGRVSAAVKVAATPDHPATVPATPTNVQAGSTGTSIYLSWTAPDNGGSAITSYLVSVYAGNSGTPLQVLSVPGNSTSTLITGLAPAAYSFTVRAVNALGAGPASARSNSVVLATVPGTPRNLAVTPGDGTILARWDPPIADGGSPITGYSVQLLVGSLVVKSATVTGTSATFTGLTNNVSYTVAVTAINVMGQSSPVLGVGVPYNSPPVLTVPGTQTVQYSDPLSFTVSARGPEPADHLTFTASGLPAGLKFVDNGNGTGSVSGAVTAVPAIYTVSFTVNDGHNPPVTQTVQINVTKETLQITPSATSPVSVAVTGPTGIAKKVTLRATVREANEATANDLSETIPITYTLQPLGSGRSYTKTTTPMLFLGKAHPQIRTSPTVTFSNVVQNVYRVRISTNTAYYEGSGYSMLSVYSTAVHGSVTAEGDLLVNNNSAYFNVSVVQPATGKYQSTFRYIEHHSTGDVTLTGKLVGGMVFSGKYAYMQLKGSMNGTGGYRLGVSIYDKGSPARIDQVGLQVIGPTAAIDPDCSFAMTSFHGGDAKIRR